MPISDTMLPEFDQESAGTRKTLARVPDGNLDWKPHEKSWSFRELATHLSNLPRWTVMVAGDSSFDIAPVGQEPPREEPVDSAEQAVRMFDENAAAAREAIAGLTDEQMMETWTLLAGGEEILSMPRGAVIRSTILNHMIHHRAQLGLYLRLNDIPLPGLYGPTADEQ